MLDSHSDQNGTETLTATSTLESGISALSDQWRKSGLVAGDTVLVHSSISRTLKAAKRQQPEFTPTHVLESLKRAVGETGTLLLPLFNFDFTKGVGFDIRSTPSHMGALTEAARQTQGAVRTGHPIYSFAVIGRNAPLFEHVRNESGYGPDSPFAMLRELDGKIAVIDLDDQGSMTFYHHIEEVHHVSYRIQKHFTGPYTDWSGDTANRTFSLFVRNLEMGVLTHVNPMGELLWQQGLYSGSRPNEGTGMRVISARKMFDSVSRVIEEGKALETLYRIGE